MMDFDYDFFKDIILVVTPTIMIVLSSKIFLDSWQKRNEKSKIKRQILDEYEKSVKYYRAYLYVFIRKILNPISAYTNVSDKKTKNEYIKLQENIHTVEFSGSKFISSLRLYYQNEDLIDEYRKIMDHLGSMSLIIEQIIDKNSNDNTKNFENFLELEKQSREILQKFETKLITLELHKNII